MADVTPGSRAGSHLAAFWLAGILVVAVAVRAAVFRGYSASDDANYAAAAWQIARGNFPPAAPDIPPHYHTRVGLLLPVAILFRLFGPSEITLLLVPLAFSAGTLALAYFAGRIFFSVRAGLAAMALYAIMPVDARFATWLLSDTPSAFWSACGVILLYLGSRNAENRRKALLGLAAAGCFGASWLTRGQVAQLVPFVVAALAIWCARDRRNFWLAATCLAGVLGIFVIEGLVYFAIYGDFLHRLHAMETLYATDTNWFFKEGSPYGWESGHYAWGLFRRLFKTGPAAIFLNPGIGLLPLTAGIAILHIIRFRRRGFLFLAAWFLYAVAAFNFGSASLRRYEPLPWSDAYLVPVIFPAVLVTAGWLSEGVMRADADGGVTAERRFWGTLVCAAILLGSAYGLFQHVRQGVGCPGLRRAARVLKPSDMVYTDPNSLRALEFFWGYPPAPRAYDFSAIPVENLPQGSRVLVSLHELQRLRDLKGYHPPEYALAPPASWRLEWQAGKVRIYLVEQAETSSPPETGE